MTTRRDSTKNRDLNAQRAQVVNPLTSEELNPHLDESVNAARTLLVNPGYSVHEKIMDAITATATGYIDCRQAKGCDLQFSVTGTVSIAIYISSQVDESDYTSVTYIDVTADLTGAAAVVSSLILSDGVGDLADKYIKIVATITSGTVSVDAVKRY